MVTDFGIARAVNSNTMTMTGGNALGSVHYFSPEQARGSVVSPKTDIYSLGIVMYEMVTGKIPFDGENSVAVAVKQLQEQPVRPREIQPDIPQGFEDIILRCMKKSADQRYDSARSLIDDLDAFMINPNERYGIIRQASDKVETAVNKPVNSADALAQVITLEKDISERRQSRLRDTILAIAVALLCIVGVVIGLSYLWKEMGGEINLTTRNSNEFTVENYKNYSYDEVSEMLSAEGINHKAIYSPDEQIAAGNIIDQSIKPGTTINRDGTYISGNELILTVSEGSNFIIVPDVSEEGAEEAAAKLSEAGLNVIKSERYNVDVPAGMVMSMDPPSGAKVKKGDRVDLVISKGRNTDPLPNMVGVQVTGAAQQLNALGYETSIVIPAYLQGQESSLYVLSMDPIPNTAGINGVVTLYAATYQEVFPSPTPVATTTQASETTAAQEETQQEEETQPPESEETEPQGDGESESTANDGD